MVPPTTCCMQEKIPFDTQLNHFSFSTILEMKTLLFSFSLEVDKCLDGFIPWGPGSC